MTVAATVEKAMVKETPPESKSKPAIPNGLLGMIVFILTEIMFFAGLVSAHMIVKSNAAGGIWPPIGQPRLPLEQTLFNSAALILSGIFLWLANRKFKEAHQKALRPMLLSLALGVFFVVAQGFEWVALIAQGLTLTSSAHGAFFYLIIGIHGLHAVCAILILGYALVKLLRNNLDPSTFWTAQAFWYFVVGVWPILYIQVYL